MNVSIAIPQLFYDLIARVIPGFYFLKTWRIVFGKEILGFDSTNNWAKVTFSGIAFMAICYLIGWLLSSPAYFYEVYKVHFKINGEKLKFNKNPEEWNEHTKYDWVRLLHEPAGYRIVKLRAERRMLKSALAGTVIILLLVLLAPLLNNYENIGGGGNIDYLLLKVLVLFLVVMGFMITVLKLSMQYK